ncbi:hypothetical protein [Microbacterium kunmingense]|uniref:hypothetical protein n=1 Tax=Microbacterium kunmingense TaxID=2915939 RepID=UPI003D72EBC9
MKVAICVTFVAWVACVAAGCRGTARWRRWSRMRPVGDHSCHFDSRGLIEVAELVAFGVGGDHLCHFDPRRLIEVAELVGFGGRGRPSVPPRSAPGDRGGGIGRVGRRQATICATSICAG